jgi:uncharacterized sulfatase
MWIRIWVIAIFVGLGCHLAAAGEENAQPSASSKRPPNVVFILADDLGWADLGCYGNRFNETPRIDGLARDGMRFTQFYAAGPVCSPTRAAILTGQYQARFGLTAHIPGHWKPFEKLAEPPCALRLPGELVTLAKRLREAGYATGHLGKWHLGGQGSGPTDHGFRDAEEVSGHTVPGLRQRPPSTTPKRLAEYLADRAIGFIEEHRGQPFFLCVNHFAVHIPLDTTPALQRKYEAKRNVEGYSCHPLYAGLLEELDTSVGRVLDALARYELDRHTIVIFTSDNGGLEREVGGWPGTENHPLRDEKGSLYEGGIRVPLVVRWPGVVPAGAVSGAVGISVDFYPTLLEAAGLPMGGLAAPRDHKLDGVSLVGVLKNAEATIDRAAIYWHYPHYHHSRPSGAIRAGDWKAIEFFDTGDVELFNLKDDIGESRNLAGEMREKAAEMRMQLARWREEVNAQMPQANPAYNAARANEWWSRAGMRPTDAPGTYKKGERK